MVKILSEIKDQSIPLLPHLITGTTISQANRIELTGYSDQVNVPDMAKSQITHTVIPKKRNAEKIMADIF